MSFPFLNTKLIFKHQSHVSVRDPVMRFMVSSVVVWMLAHLHMHKANLGITRNQITAVIWRMQKFLKALLWERAHSFSFSVNVCELNKKLTVRQKIFNLLRHLEYCSLIWLKSHFKSIVGINYRLKWFSLCVFPDMADICTSSRRVGRVSEGQSGGHQLVVTGLHGGGHPAELWDHMDAGHPRASDHGTELGLKTETSQGAQCNLYLQPFCLMLCNWH